jgi:hypothetical protein
MWVVPVKTTVPGAGSGGPPRAAGQASGRVLVIEAVNVAELGPPPPVLEQPLKLSGVGFVPPLSGLVAVWGLLSWPRPGLNFVLPFTVVHLPITVPAAPALPGPMKGAATNAATRRTAYRRTMLDLSPLSCDFSVSPGPANAALWANVVGRREA